MASVWRQVVLCDAERLDARLSLAAACDAPAHQLLGLGARRSAVETGFLFLASGFRCFAFSLTGTSASAQWLAACSERDASLRADFDVLARLGTDTVSVYDNADDWLSALERALQGDEPATRVTCMLKARELASRVGQPHASSQAAASTSDSDSVAGEPLDNVAAPQAGASKVLIDDLSLSLSVLLTESASP